MHVFCSFFFYKKYFSPDSITNSEFIAKILHYLAEIKEDFITENH